MNVTNFHATAQINAMVGNIAHPQGYQGHLAQHDLILSEWKEGMGNLHKLKDDSDALRDDVQDILFTTYGLAHRLGMEWERDVKLGGEGESNYEWVRDQVLDTETTEKQMDVIGGILEDLETQINFNHAKLIDGTDYDTVTLVRRLLVRTYSLGHNLGYPVDEDYREVVSSNMTKFDHTLDDAQATREKYKELGVEVVTIPVQYTRPDDVEVTLYVTKSAFDQVGNDGKDYPANKWLKSIHFREPQYRPIRVLPAQIRFVNQTPEQVKEKRITITVAGVCNSGVSHVSAVIAKALAEANFDTITVVDRDGAEFGRNSFHLAEELKTIPTDAWVRPEITIEQRMLSAAIKMDGNVERRERGVTSVSTPADESPYAEEVKGKPYFAGQGFVKQ